MAQLAVSDMQHQNDNPADVALCHKACAVSCEIQVHSVGIVIENAAALSACIASQSKTEPVADRKCHFCR